MRIRLRGPGHAGSLLAELNRCRQSGRYCDVFLQVGRRTFAAHRAVLACAGTYFGNLLGQAASAPAAADAAAAVSLDFISPAHFEKVLSFVYTGEILADLLDVGVLYELAERLGVSELAGACHATLPDLRGPAAGPGELAAAPSVCSSAASRSSSLSSSWSSPAAPSPHAQAGATAGRLSPAGTASADLKIEDIRSLVGYGQILGQGGEVPPTGPELPTKEEQTGGEEAVSQTTGDSEPSGRRPFPEWASGAEDLTASWGREQRREPPCDGATRHAEEERWGRLAGEIIELSDDENFTAEGDDDEEDEEEDDEEEDDLVCVENGHGSQRGGQVTFALLVYQEVVSRSQLLVG